ncbi:unnamed protein product [Kluyveromyces dobzhanskii CBS 2104]|uniref:WGS project CCBQ000000000 data, contig 00098 n=1 Tax=Kluyveromyces dobzhanskii CBS 2104 TaxID=1427455 RepID=A0A0A8L5C4_9SACH|nr:unnamed protein product [Kluyveromyces dobzhanskii CBS 2104]
MFFEYSIRSGVFQLIVLCALIFSAIPVDAFYPCTAERYLASGSAFEVGIENSKYAAQLLQLDSASSKSVSTVQSKANSPSKSVEVPVKPGMSILSTDNNTQAYFVNVTIGNEIYPLVVDSGSAYLWVYGSPCKSQACTKNKLFSTDYVKRADDDSTFSLKYSSGTASGDVYEDRIIVNKLATTQNFTFGVADQVPDIFDNYPVSGIFGLPSNNSDSIESIISVLSESGAISKEKFSMVIGSLNSRDNSTSANSDLQAPLSENKGLFIIGDLEEDLYTGDVHYAPLIVNDNHYWQLKIDGIYVSSQEVNFSTSVTVAGSQSSILRSGIVDSGTTLLILPTQDALDLHTYFTNSVSDGTNFAVLCNSTQEISLKINGVEWSISSDDYLGEAYPESSYYYGYCVSNIQGLDLDESWILGDVFLKDKYAVFDVENQQFGLATKNENAVLVPYDGSSDPGTTASNGTISISVSASTSSSTSTSGSSSATKSTSSSFGGGSNVHPHLFWSWTPALVLLSF